MSQRLDPTTVFTGSAARGATELVGFSYAPGSHTIYADVGRSDSYIEDGTQDRPYKVLKTAVLAANALATISAPCDIHVAPGIYNEDPFTVAPYVRIQGCGWVTTILKSNDLNNHFITLDAATVIRDVCIWGPTALGKACINHEANDTRATGIVEVTISRGYYGIYSHPASSQGNLLLSNVAYAYAGNTTNTFILAENYGELFASGCLAAAPSGKIGTAYAATGPNTVMTVIESYHECANGVGVFSDNGAMVRVISSVFSAGTTALQAGSNDAPKIRAEAVLIHRIVGGGYTNDIKVDSAAATVHFTGTASKDRIVNTVGATIYANFQNRETGQEGACVLGELNVGATAASTLPMISYGKAAYLSGLYTGGGVTRSPSPSRVLNIVGGTGYVNDGVNPIEVSWSGTTVTITANKTEYVYVTKTGAVTHSEVQPSYAENVVLAQAVASATDIVVLTRDEICISHTLSRLQEFFEDVIGPLSVTGGLTTASATALKINVSGGEFMVGLSEREITGGSNVGFYLVSHNGAGGWTYTAATEIDTAHIDLGSGPVVYPGADHWKKDAWYVVVDSSGETYYCVYGQAAFTDQAAAENGAFPVVPDILQHYGMRAAGIVSHKEDAVITSVLDMRPMLGQNAPVTAAVAADHDLLLNLDHDTHTQYLNTARADAWVLTKAGNTVNLVDNGNNHDHVGGDGAQISHTNLSNIGTRTHLQLESDINTHIGDTANPHATTKAQVGLTNVTDDAQFKRTANDFSTFTAKGSAVNADLIIIEDSADGGSKKKVTLDALPYPALAVHGSTHISGASDPVPAVVAGGASGLMTGSDKTKLDGIASSATNTPLGSASPTDVGATNAGIALNASREDHVHAHGTQLGGTLHANVIAGGAAGFMTGSDKTKLDGVTAGATNTPLGSASPLAVGTTNVGVSTSAAHEDHVHAHGNQLGGTLHAVAVASTSNGFMAAADKTKLDGVATGATNTPLGSSLPQALGTANVGASASASHEDHVHAHGDQLGGTLHAAATTLVNGFMSATDKTKLDGVATGATNNIFGNGYQTSISLARSTYNADTTFQNKVNFTTTALTAGTYRVSWTAVLDGSQTNRDVEAQLYNSTDAAIIGVVQIFRPGSTTERARVGGFAEVTYTGVAKTFQIQYRTTNVAATVGIADARIEVWRVA